MAVTLRLDPSVARFAAASNDAGPVGLVIYTGATVRRVGYYADAKGRETFGEYMLRLSLDPAAVDLGRIGGGTAPLLREHNTVVDAVIGRVTSARINGNQLVGEAVLSDAPGDADVVRKIRSGIAANLSVGANLHTVEPENLDAEPPLFVATRWEPFEVSAVAVGADPGARVALNLITPAAPAQEPQTMLQPVTPVAPLDVAAISARNNAVRESGKLLGLSLEQLQPVLDDVALSLADARAKLFDIRAAQQDRQPIDGARSTIEVGRDEVAKLGETMARTIAARHEGKVLADSDGYRARECRHRSLIELASLHLSARGVDTVGWTASQIADKAFTMRGAQFAHSTSDFPEILGDSVTRVLRAGYELAPGIYRQIARRGEARDYRARKHVLLGDTPDFVETPQGASTEYGPMTESKGSVTVKDYTAGVAITRQVLINDDLGAFMDLARRIGMKAERFAERTVLGVLSGGTSGDWGDGDPLFHTNHANIDGTAAVVSVTRLGAMRALMRKQGSLAEASQTEEALDIAPRFLVVPAAIEIAAMQVLYPQGYMPTASTSALVPALAGIQVLGSPVLDAASATAYYLVCDPNVFDGLEYVQLNGESGPVVSQATDFDSEGFKIRARLTIAAHCRDYRGVVRNAGA